MALRETMHSIIVLFLLISVAVLIEGLLYLLFPQKVKRVVQECPVCLFRIVGGLVVALGLMLIYLLVSL